MIYEVWGVDVGETPPPVLLESFRDDPARPKYAELAAAAAEEQLRADGATQLQIRLKPEAAGA